MVDLALIDGGLAPVLPCRVAGARWTVTVERCRGAWLLRGAPSTFDSTLPTATMAHPLGQGIVAWLAPNAWLLMGRVAPEQLAGAWFEVATRYTTLRVGGDAADFVAAMTGLDVRDMRPGRSLPTCIAGLPVLILPIADDIVIFAERGREQYWIDWLRRAGE